MTALGRYKLMERLGQGGMATVYRAEDPTLGRHVAVKVMHPFVAERSEASLRFEREARAVAGLHHPNVMQLHDYHAAEGETPAYLVMELLTGPSLRAFLDKNGAPLAELGAIIGVRVAQALHAAHARGIVHRDVKPENVMFDLAGGCRVVLCDFGIARVLVDGQSGMTATGALIGSPAYMSPEQARGEDVDARSDLFSLGSLLYVLATGAAPFTASQPLAVMNRIAKGEHAPPSAKNARVPRYLERVIERCLRVEPAARFASAAEVAEALVEGLRADGMADLDGELAAYLADPPGYNARFVPRLVEVALAQARAAQAAGQSARALASASRVLSWDPTQAEALSLLGRLQPHPVRRWLATAALTVCALGGGGAWLRFHHKPAATIGNGNGNARTPASENGILPASEIVNANVNNPKPAPSAAAIPPARTDHPRPRHAALQTNPAPSAAPVAVALAPVAAPSPPAPPPPAPTTAQLVVEIAPWCDLTVDGTARGRPPQTLTLAPGPHHVECKNPIAHVALNRDLQLAAGETQHIKEHLYAAAHVAPHLTRADSFALDDGPPGPAARDAVPGRHRVTTFSAGREVDAAYLDIRPGGCRLLDTPELTCEKP